MSLDRLGYQADINSRSNMSSVVMRLPRYLSSEWAKEAQNSRDRGKESDFAQLTRFVVKKRQSWPALNMGNSLVQDPVTKGNRIRDIDLERMYLPISDTVRTRRRREIVRGKENARKIIRAKGTQWEDQSVYFVTEIGHLIEKCFKFQGKPYEERKKIANVKRLCHLCLCRGHIASHCKKSRGCFVPGCGERHHPMLHPVETTKDGKKDARENENKVNKLNHLLFQPEMYRLVIAVPPAPSRIGCV